MADASPPDAKPAGALFVNSALEARCPGLEPALRAKMESGLQRHSEPMNTSTLRRIFKAFHYRDFRLMWVGACTSSIGTWMQLLAQGWLIWKMSHSPFLLSLDPILQA